MIIPRQWVPKLPAYDYGHLSINAHIRASKPDPLPFVGRIFMTQPRRKRRRSGYKGAATRLAQKFAGKQFLS